MFTDHPAFLNPQVAQAPDAATNVACAFAPQTYDKALFALALLTTVATFPMIFMGGLVTSHHAGMSVPDWPNSYHYNMFLFPPRLWIGGIFYEHTHRLMGTVVGFLSMALSAYAWRGELVSAISACAARPWVRWTTLALLIAAMFHAPLAGTVISILIIATYVWRSALAALIPEGSTSSAVRWTTLLVLLGVIFQGVLGGLRVVFVNLDLAIIHACFAQAFFCLAAFSAIIASRWWITPQSREPLPHDSFLRLLSVLTVALIFAQLVVGATMRHFDAGLAIPDLPFAYGHWLPPISAVGLDQINKTRTWDLNLDPVTLQQVWLAFAHRIGALLVSLMVLTLAGRVLYRSVAQPTLRNWSITIVLLLVAQVTLGVFTVLLRKPADIASLHVATGALLLVCAFTLTTFIFRLTRSGGRETALAHDPPSATRLGSRGTVAALS